MRNDPFASRGPFSEFGRCCAGAGACSCPTWEKPGGFDPGRVEVEPTRFGWTGNGNMPSDSLMAVRAAILPIVRERAEIYNRFTTVLASLPADAIETSPFAAAAPASSYVTALVAPFYINPESAATQALDAMEALFDRSVGLFPCEDIDPLTKMVECFLIDTLCIGVDMHWWGLEFKYCNPALGLGGWPPLCPCSRSWLFYWEIGLAVALAVFLANPGGIARGVAVAVARAVVVAG